MVDVVEHLKNVSDELKGITKFMNKDSKLVISHVESKWEPILTLFEIMQLKIDEGPHLRVSNKELIGIAKKLNLKLVDKTSTSLLISISTLVFKKKDNL